jgi:hypothetical protein
MDDLKPVPYRTPAGLEIGKNYQPPKPRDIRVDLIDIYDQDRIQMAYITDGRELRLEKIVLASCVATVFFLSIVLLALGG